MLEQPIVSLNGNAAFYRLQPLTDASIQPSLALNLGKGFYGWDGVDDGRRWAWADRRSELQLFNFGKRNQVVMLEAGLFSPNSTKAYIHGGENEVEEVQFVAEGNVSLRKKITLKPGKNVLKFETDLPAVKVGQDPRALALRLMKPGLKPVKD